MNTNNSLTSHVSGKIARTNPLEGGPELQAMIEGSAVVSSTWGDYATKLMDLRDLTPDEAVAALQLSPEELADPEIQFTNPTKFSYYTDIMVQQFKDEAEQDLMVEVRRLQAVVDEVMSGYIVADPELAAEEADKIQDDIDGDRDTFLERRDKSDKERVEHDLRQSARCMKHDALHSGVYIQLDEFVATMLSTNVTNGEFPSELASHWVSSLRMTVEDFHSENMESELPLNEMTVGKDAFITMKTYLQHLYQESMARATSRWEWICPVFMAATLADHPLVTGEEKS